MSKRSTSKFSKWILLWNSSLVLSQSRDLVSSKWTRLLARFLLTECSELADLSHQHAATCFYPITFPHTLDLSSQQRDEPTMVAVWDRRKAKEAKEAQNSWWGKRRCEGEKGESKISSLSNNRGERDWSFYKEIGWPLCYWPGQFCCQFRRQLRCQSRRFLTRIIALRKRFDNFY